MDTGPIMDTTTILDDSYVSVSTYSIYSIHNIYSIYVQYLQYLRTISTYIYRTVSPAPQSNRHRAYLDTINILGDSYISVSRSEALPDSDYLSLLRYLSFFQF